MDTDGYVHLPQRPGLGYDLNWDYIREHLIDDTGSVTLGDWATD
jgi:L-alanine-DL-glutamate epimerase-like enolase superfamily enzyme